MSSLISFFLHLFSQFSLPILFILCQIELSLSLYVPIISSIWVFQLDSDHVRLFHWCALGSLPNPMKMADKTRDLMEVDPITPRLNYYLDYQFIVHLIIMTTRNQHRIFICVKQSIWRAMPVEFCLI
ncbi:hypothetical protein F4804DRAFT_80008 [Jackrogersella minutella]|nr:hypothetical protein F4804DRAFT_80008 [Jackrogersella minutella]